MADKIFEINGHWYRRRVVNGVNKIAPVENPTTLLKGLAKFNVFTVKAIHPNYEQQHQELMKLVKAAKDLLGPRPNNSFGFENADIAAMHVVVGDVATEGPDDAPAL